MLRLPLPSRPALAALGFAGLVLATVAAAAAVFATTVFAAVPAGAAAPPLPPADPVGWLQDYLRIDTTNPPARGATGGEARAAGYLARILHRHGVATTTYHTADGRASLVARVEGKRPGEALLLMHHLDVVPPGPDWRRPPFSGDLVAGELWGRGALDVKSLGIAHLVAFLEVARRPEPPERGLVFLAVADEESGGVRGTAWLLDHHPEVFRGVAAVLGEGGTNKVVGDRLLWWGIETAQKRPLWLEATTSGRGGHASGLNPHSAAHSLILALARVLELPPQWRVTGAARRYFGALAPLHTGETRRRFADLDAWVGPDGPRGGMLPGQANLFLDTVQVTEIEAGERINVVAPTATARLDVRLLPETDADAFLDRLREAFGGQVEVEVLLSSPPSPASPVEHPAYRAVAEVLGAEGPVVPALIAGFTDSRYFRERGIPAYGVSPFALEGPILAGIHGRDERVPVDELRAGIERMRRIVAAYASGTAGSSR
ncbi:MAG TPA: M20/M25/M40 family metallo-hydrolase [Thermoanaerobaculia bacterium]|nr:M20/M25/M40 family metallo-hydrolase [Thermoanaerobaculia bacterium]